MGIPDITHRTEGPARVNVYEKDALLSFSGDKIKVIGELNPGEEKEQSMKSTSAVAVMVMILLVNPVLLAGGNPIPGRWEKVAETQKGVKVTVQLKDGSSQKCRYQSVGEEYLTCLNTYDEELRFELSSIDKVFLDTSKQAGKKGTLWGAVTGSAGMLVFGYALTAGGDVEWANPPTGQIIAACFGAGVGALGGYLVGRAVGSPGEPIYMSKEVALAEAK